MTVKCLDNNQKKEVAIYYVSHKVRIKELSEQYNTSSRTIRRVLEEEGVASVKRRIPKAIPTQPGFVATVIRFIKGLFLVKPTHA